MKTLGLFTKFWQPGHVKTRLADQMGREKAAEVYRVFVEHLACQLETSADRRELVISPDRRVSDPAFECFRNWICVPQGSGNLGDRMLRYLSNAKSEDHKVVIIGGDCPTLDTECIEAAFHALDDSKVVIGPCDDGGYYLLGFRGPWFGSLSAMFDDMPWGTGVVFQRTVAALESIEIKPALLPDERDVDTYDDLQDLLARLPSDSSNQILRSRIIDTLNNISSEGRSR